MELKSTRESQLEEINDELLAVLEHWLPFIESEGDDPQQQPWVEKARAAIAKAHLISAMKELCKSMLSAAPTVPHLEGEDEAFLFVEYDEETGHAEIRDPADPRNKHLLALYTRPQPIGEINDWRKEAGSDVSEFAGKVKAEIEARALEEAADKFEGWLDQVVYELRQLAAQKRAAAGEGK